MKNRSAPATALLPGLLGIIWLALVTALYFVTHKPFDSPQALVLATSAYKVIIAASLMMLCGGLGYRLTQVKWRWQPDLTGYSPLEISVLQAALGAGVLSLGLLVAGATIGYPVWFLWTALGGLLVVLSKDCLRWVRSWLGLGELWQSSGKLGRVLFALSGVVLGSNLLVALAPPLKFDALVYHLALPQAYLQAGRLVYPPWNMFWGMPQTGEVFYTWAMALGGAEAAAVVGWLVALIALSGVIAYAGRRLGARSAAVAMASLLAGLTFAQATAWAYVDYWVMAFAIAFLILFDQALKEGRSKNYFWAGIFAGFAFASKYTAGILVICAGFAIVWDALRKRRWPDLVRRLGIFLVGGSLPALPWLIKNLLATGNPFYPFLFPSGAMTAPRLDFYQTGQAWGNWIDIFFLPLRATWLGQEGGPGYSASLGPLALGLGALTLILLFQPGKRRLKAGLRSASLVVLPGLLIWAILGRFTAYLLQSRLYFALFPALAVLAGGGFALLERQKLPGIRLGRVAGSLVAFVLLLSALESSLQLVHKDTLAYLTGISDRQSYLEHNLGWYARATQAIRSLPENALVLLLFEPRSLDCLPKCRPDEILDRWLVDLERQNYSKEVFTDWRAEGFTHVLYYRTGAEYLFAQEPRFNQVNVGATDALLSELPQMADFGGVYILYELAP